MEKITFCIPSKNNLRYLKGSINSIQKNSAIAHDMIVYVDADTDGTCDWLNANGITFIKNESTEPTGIANAYNECIRAAKTTAVCAFHADMVMGVGMDTNLLKHLKPKTLVCATRIEPPGLHPPGKEKILQDFGMYPEDFKNESFNTYVQGLVKKNKDVKTSGIFAPWVAVKEDILEIGGMDGQLKSYYEDSDFFQRMILNGCTMAQSWDSLVYHYTCRGGQFQDGVEKQTNDPTFHKMRATSARRYIRKWQSWIRNDEYQHPVMPKKLNIGFVIRDVTDENFISHIEPFATHVYIDNWELAERYIDKEQKDSIIDLRTRIYNHGYIEQNNNNVLLYFSQKDFLSNNPTENMGIIQNLGIIIADGYEPDAEMQLGIFKLKTFGNLIDYTPSLIKI